MSLPSAVMSMYEDIYEDILAICVKNMLPLGFNKREILDTVEVLYKEKIESLEG